MVKAILIGIPGSILLMAIFLFVYMAFEDREALEMGGESLTAWVEKEMGEECGKK